MTCASFPTVTGVILAGGMARRMNGQDKGLLEHQGQPLLQHALARLAPQVDHLLINANRNIDRYQAFGYPVVSDTLADFQGPLAGILAALQAMQTDYLLTVPCDCPNLSPHLRRRLLETMLATGKTIAIAHDGERRQPVFCLISRQLTTDLAQFLTTGARKTEQWLTRHDYVEVDFSDQPANFININTPQELKASVPVAPLPVLGIAAFSGTGKTTLLKKLIPQLTASGLRVAVIKHAHHRFDIDKPGKDSYEIREAGASQVVVSSSRLLALMQTFSTPQSEPSLQACLDRLDMQQLDLILVEGFKHSAIPKLELHRPTLGHPLLFTEDKQILAIASDAPLAKADTIPVLDLNDVGKIVEFIQSFIYQHSS